MIRSQIDPISERLNSIEIETGPLYDYLDGHRELKVIIEGPWYVARLKYELALDLAKFGHKVVLSANILWGSCCYGWDLAQVTSADLIVHIGHDKYLNANESIVYLPVHFNDRRAIFELLRILIELLNRDNIKVVEVLAALEFMRYRDEVIAIMLKYEIHVLPSGHPKGTNQNGQLLACASVTCQQSMQLDDYMPIVIIADSFFATGVHRRARRPVLCADPFRDRVFWLDDQDPVFAHERHAVLRKALAASSFGILVETRQGQSKIKLAEFIQKKLSLCGKSSLLIGITEVSIEKLDQYAAIEIWINTACDRLPLDRKSMRQEESLTLKETFTMIRTLECCADQRVSEMTSCDCIK